MKQSLTSLRSDRTFKVWEYQVSHGQLLIRSPKAPATTTTPERLTNVDVVFLGVEYMAIPRIFRGLEFTTPKANEIQDLEILLGSTVDPGNVRILLSNKQRFPIVASNVSFLENDWDIFESPFEFRSQYRSMS